MTSPIDSVEIYLKGRYREEVKESRVPGRDPVFVARYPALPGCIAQADSWNAALSALRRLREPFIRALFEQGMEIPTPDSLSPPSITIGAVIDPLSGFVGEPPEEESPELDLADKLDNDTERSSSLYAVA